MKVSLSAVAEVQALFLVGGLGSSLYLLKYIKLKLSESILHVMQPEAGYKLQWRNNCRYCAIMRGAVLYKLGLAFVKDRLMRASYGTVSRIPFREGRDPPSRRVYDFAGQAKCAGVMHWFVTKVSIRLILISGSKGRKWGLSGTEVLFGLWIHRTE
jgi:hypothetical protein